MRQTGKKREKVSHLYRPGRFVGLSSLQMELLFTGQSHLKAIWLQEMDLVFL